MKTKLTIAGAAALLFPLISTLRAEDFTLKSTIYVFRQSDFQDIDIPGAMGAADGHALIFKSPATARFDQQTLSLEGSNAAWSSGGSPPEQFTRVAAPPMVPIAPGKPVTMTSSTAIQYLEQLPDGKLQVREIPADSREAPHIRLTFTANPGENATDALLLDCDMDIVTVNARKNIPGVALNVGKPVVRRFREILTVPIRLGQSAALILEAPNGSDFSVLMLLELATAQASAPTVSNDGELGGESGAPKEPSGAPKAINGGVAVAAGADEAYARNKFGNSSADPKTESFVLAQGTYFGGWLRDQSLGKAKFDEITSALVPDLALNHFIPAKDPKNADLLIVVHWGVTYISEPMVNTSRGPFSLSSSGWGYDSLHGAYLDPMNPNWYTASINSQLLGYDAPRQKEYYRSLGLSWETSEMLQRLFEDPLDERYFVILEAYDFSTVKSAGTNSKPKLLWSVHYSMTAIGYNFTTALPAMSKVAAHFLGRNMGGVLLNAQKIPDGVVKIGEPKAIEEAQWK
jgi:hypothetical protein